MPDFDDVNRLLSRRKALTALGAGFTGFLTGCSTDAEPESTTTQTATTTPTPTPTDSPTPTRTPEPERDYWIEKPFQQDYEENMIPPENSEFAHLIRELYPKMPIQNQLDEAPEHRYAEVILQPFGEMPIDTGLGWTQAENTAAAARYVMHEMLDEEYQKPTDPNHTDSHHALPVPLVIDGTISHGVDIHSDHGLTTNLASNEANESTTGPVNTLNPREKQQALNGNGENLSVTESKLGVSYLNPGGGSDVAYRLENFNSVTGDFQEHGLTPEAVEALHMELGKLVPGLYPEGDTPSNPVAWMTRSGAERLNSEVVENYDGVDHLVEMHNGFQNTVAQDELGVIYEDETGSLTVEAVPESEFDGSQLWAPEP